MQLTDAYERLKDQTVHSFLTGNAGTGKSTLIRKFIEEHKNECIVLAPTGIAAVNIGGVTIHKFCHFPARPVNFNSIKTLQPNEEKFAVLKAAKYIIIDEISMVRADLMDQIDWFLTKNYAKHLKFIMIGDLDQLPPVLSNPEEKKMIQARYKSEFFFDATMWHNKTFETIRLEKIFRQSDPVFIKLLNDIKGNTLSPICLDRLNARCVNTGRLNVTDGVMLCSTNAIADEVNYDMIQRLPGALLSFEGKIEGDFNEKDCPVKRVLELKVGCRVMICRNDPGGQYQNGTLGTFTGEGEVTLDNGDEIYVPVHKFESVNYKYNKGEDNIKAEVTGFFMQYPLKVAYAMSIHKSQGQTFEKVIIDLGTGAFAHGQTYVALSRCKSIEGLILRQPITKRDLIYNPDVIKFNVKNSCYISQPSISL